MGVSHLFRLVLRLLPLHSPWLAKWPAQSCTKDVKGLIGHLAVFLCACPDLRHRFNRSLAAAATFRSSCDWQVTKLLQLSLEPALDETRPNIGQ